MFQHSALPTATVDLPQALPRPSTLINRLYRWIPLPRTAREYLVWVLCMGIASGLISLQLWLSLQIAQAEQQLSLLQVEYANVEQENSELLWQISQFTALERIQIESSRQGFVPSLQRQYQWATSESITTLPVPEPAQAVAAVSVAQVATAQSVAAAPWHVSLQKSWTAWWQPQQQSLINTWQMCLRWLSFSD